MIIARSVARNGIAMLRFGSATAEDYLNRPLGARGDCAEFSGIWVGIFPWNPVPPTTPPGEFDQIPDPILSSCAL
jgi:hypothetical protein